MFTPRDRESMIQVARTATYKTRGFSVWPYAYTVYPKHRDASFAVRVDDINPALTSALANVIFTKNPQNRFVSLGFYYALIEKITMHPGLGAQLWQNIIVVLKGSNAYAYLTRHMDMNIDHNNSDSFRFSDLDVAIYINPDIPSGMYDGIRAKLHVVVSQTISQYKRRLDDMFFNDGNDARSKGYQHFMDKEAIATFKRDYKNEIKTIPGAISPFEDRSACTRSSFIMKTSLGLSDSVVKIDVPHFESCENIPLKMSPFVCSVNDTIDFVRAVDESGNDLIGSFTLFRIKLASIQSMSRTNDDVHQNDVQSSPPSLSSDSESLTSVSSDNPSPPRSPPQALYRPPRPKTNHRRACESIFTAADFIDVTISSQNDAEQKAFWKSAKQCINIRDPFAFGWPSIRGSKTMHIVVPDIRMCMTELDKMLNLYSCPENKRSKRVQRLQWLGQYVDRLD